MIRPGLIWRIFRREALDTFRDWNMLSVVLVLPFVLMPLTGVIMMEIASQEAAERAKDGAIGEPGKKSPESAPRYRVAILGGAAEKAATRLRDWDRFVITPVPSPIPAAADVEDPPYGEKVSKSQRQKRNLLDSELRRRIGAGEFDAVIVTGERPVKDTALTNTWVIVFSDGTVSKSQKAGSALEKVLERWQRDDRKNRLLELGETESSLRPLQYVTEEVAPIGRVIAYHAASAAPVLLFLLLASGCYYAAINAIPGEKERGTLATILSAPLRPIEVLLGKWLNVSLVGVAGAFANTLSMLLTGGLLASAAVRQAAAATGKTGNIPGLTAQGLAEWFLALWPEIGLLLFSLIMVGMLFGALTLLACMFARGMADAPYLLTPFILICCLPAAFAAMPSTEWSSAVAMTPGLNMAVMIRGIFRQETLGLGLIIAAFLVNAAASAGVLIFGAWVFQSERIRFSEAGAWKDLLTRKTAGAPNGAISAAAMLLIIAGAFYSQFLTTGHGLAVMATVSLAWIGAVPLALIWYFRLPWLDVLSWRRPRLGVWPGTVLVGLTASIAAFPLSRIYPAPPEWLEAFAKPFLALLAQPGGLAIALFTVAVLPAICEEIAFRGLIQAGFLKRFPPPAAIGLTALCFGLAHFSLFRFLPTAAIGLVLGWLAWRTRSIFPGMVVHALNNGLAVVALAASARDGKVSEDDMPWFVLAMGTTVFALGMFAIVRGSRTPVTPSAPPR